MRKTCKMLLFRIAVWLGWEQKWFYHRGVWLATATDKINSVSFVTITVCFLCSLAGKSSYPLKMHKDRPHHRAVTGVSVSLIISVHSLKDKPKLAKPTDWPNTPDCEQKCVMHMIPFELFQSSVTNPSEFPSLPPISCLHPLHRCMLAASRYTSLLTTWTNSSLLRMSGASFKQIWGVKLSIVVVDSHCPFVGISAFLSLLDTEVQCRAGWTANTARNDICLITLKMICWRCFCGLLKWLHVISFHHWLSQHLRNKRKWGNEPSIISAKDLRWWM